MTTKLYFVIGVDQDGDAVWDVSPSLDSAMHRREELNELCYEPVILWEVDPGGGRGVIVKAVEL